MKVVYVAGPYRADTERGVVENIRRAEAVALRIWQAGGVAICPHMNTRLFGGACPDEVWLKGDIEIMLRCDAVALVDGYRDSSGTTAEIRAAEIAEIPVFEALDAVTWVELQQQRGEVTR